MSFEVSVNKFEQEQASINQFLEGRLNDEKEFHLFNNITFKSKKELAKQRRNHIIQGILQKNTQENLTEKEKEARIQDRYL